MTKKIILSLLVIVILAGGLFGFRTYKAIFGVNTNETISGYLDLKTGIDLESLADTLHKKDFIKEKESFLYVAGLMKYGNKIRSGRFTVPANSSNLELIRHLRSSKQAAVNLVLSNARTLEDLSGKIARFIALDSMDILASFNDGTAQNVFNTERENIMSYFIPNTYEVYWNLSSTALLERIKKEHDRFWNANRLAEAQALEMTQEEVYTLASIIEKETNQNSEKPRMAAALLNRIRIGMPLQADPTAVFATGDFQTKRVLNKHTQFDSPYNTYMYKGLPPGPIAMASISSLDAILNPEKNQYLYYCARGDGSGLHNFASNLRAHNNNSRIYVRNLKKRGKR